ncbi:hypothetical protein DFS34DRAFT_18719 [Phlyctochytrium arcticum]|nr:hypothetical protein DFS34DRAFT_18719 [Phlyctochytrium arcticum]
MLFQTFASVVGGLVIAVTSVHGAYLTEQYKKVVAVNATDFVAADLADNKYYDYTRNELGPGAIEFVLRQRNASAPAHPRWTRRYREYADTYAPKYIVGASKSDVFEYGIGAKINPDTKQTQTYIHIRRFNYKSGGIVFNVTRASIPGCPYPVGVDAAVDHKTSDMFLIELCKINRTAKDDDKKNFIVIERIDSAGETVERKEIRPVVATGVHVSINQEHTRLYVAGYRYDARVSAARPFLASYKLPSLDLFYSPRYMPAIANYSTITDVTVDTRGKPIVSLDDTDGGKSILLRLNEKGNTALANATSTFQNMKLTAGKEAIYTCASENGSQDGPTYVQARTHLMLSRLANEVVANTTGCTSFTMKKIAVKYGDEVTAAFSEGKNRPILRNYVLV